MPIAASLAAVHAVTPVACADCPLGRVSGVGQGMFCPFVTRSEAAGALLARAGAMHERIWFVKSGVVGTSAAREDDPSDAIDQVHLPGSFVGLECLTRGRYQESARVLARADLCSATTEGFLEWLIQSGARLAFIDRVRRGQSAAPPGPR